MFEYDIEFSKASDELDKHDLTDVLKNCHRVDIYEVAEHIRNLGDAGIANAIDCLPVDELVLYLERRYKMKSTEEVRSFMWWNRE